MVEKPNNNSLKPKINLDFITSSEESSFDHTINEIKTSEKSSNNKKTIKKHSILLLKRRQAIKKRLNNVNSETLNKYKIVTANYSQKNHELALELEKQKGLVHMRDLEIHDLKRENFELKEYTIQIERELENYKRNSKNNIINQIDDFNLSDFKIISNLCKEIKEKVTTIEKSVSSYHQPSTTRNSNNTFISRSSSLYSNNDSLPVLISPFDFPINTISKMQHLADENSIKLLQRRDELMYDNSSNYQKENEIIINQDEKNNNKDLDIQQKDDNNNLLDVINEENENFYQNSFRSIDKLSERDLEDLNNTSKIIEKELEKNKDQLEVVEDLLKLKAKKQVKFKIVHTPPPRNLFQNEDNNDEDNFIFNEDKQKENFFKNPYYDLENRPILYNPVNDLNKQKIIYTPKKILKNSSTLIQTPENFILEKNEQNINIEINDYMETPKLAKTHNTPFIQQMTISNQLSNDTPKINDIDITVENNKIQILQNENDESSVIIKKKTLKKSKKKTQENINNDTDFEKPVKKRRKKIKKIDTENLEEFKAEINNNNQENDNDKENEQNIKTAKRIKKNISYKEPSLIKKMRRDNENKNE